MTPCNLVHIVPQEFSAEDFKSRKPEVTSGTNWRHNFSRSFFAFVCVCIFCAFHSLHLFGSELC